MAAVETQIRVLAHWAGPEHVARGEARPCWVCGALTELRDPTDLPCEPGCWEAEMARALHDYARRLIADGLAQHLLGDAAPQLAGEPYALIAAERFGDLSPHGLTQELTGHATEVRR